MTLRRGLRAGLVALSMAASLGVAKADDSASAKKAIQAQYSKLEAAAAKKDVQGMTAHLAPDFESVGLDGKTVKASEFKVRLDTALQSVKSINDVTSITKLTLKGDRATVFVKNTVSLLYINPSTKKRSRAVIERASDTQWEKKSGIWLERRSKTLAMKQTVDGKEIPMSAKQPKKG